MSLIEGLGCKAGTESSRSQATRTLCDHVVLLFKGCGCYCGMMQHTIVHHVYVCMYTHVPSGPYLRNWGGGGRYKSMPYSNNGLLKMVIIFLLYNTFQWQLIFFLKPREGDHPL